jgi:hypothetical protein
MKNKAGKARYPWFVGLTRFCQNKDAARDLKTRDLSKTSSTMNRVTSAAKSIEPLLAKCRYSDENKMLLNLTGGRFRFGRLPR